MAEQQTGQTTQQDAPQTIDDVVRKFNVQEAAQEFNARPQQAQVTAQPLQARQEVPVPDPALDVEGFKKYIGNVVAGDSEIRQTLHSINERLTKAEQERVRNQEEADLKAAVSTVKSKLKDFDDDFLEVALSHRAYRDSKFKTLWENRQRNPEAWKAALDVVSNELAKKFSVRSDPQLAENQRAMKVSRDQMATTQKVDKDEEWAEAAKDGSFDAKWRNLVSGGHY